MSLPFRRAIARLVPSVCGTLPPWEGGLHVRLSHRIVHHAMAKQLPLSYDVLWTQHSPKKKRKKTLGGPHCLLFLFFFFLCFGFCLLARMDCLGCFLRAGSRERAQPPGRARLTLSLPEGPPLMYSLDVTMSEAGCCVAGRLESGAGLTNGLVSARGHWPAPGVRLVRVPPIQTCYRTHGAKRV